MMAAEPLVKTTGSIISVSSEGGGTVALETMLRAAPALAAAVRRGIPFLGKRQVRAVPLEPSLVASAELQSALAAPQYVAQLASEPGGARAALVLDAHAIAFLLEGALGGDGSDLPQLKPQGLTAPQRAFMDRLSDGLVRALSVALERSIGLGVQKLPELSGEKSAGGSMVALALELSPQQVEEVPKAEEDPFAAFGAGAPAESPADQPSATFGKLVLAISKNALTQARASVVREDEKPLDGRLAATLETVPVELVAELGRVAMSLGQLSGLRVGDTLRLDVPVNAAIDVRIGGQLLFRGTPTTSGTQLAVQVVQRFDPEPVSQPAPVPAPAAKPVAAAAPVAKPRPKTS